MEIGQLRKLLTPDAAPAAILESANKDTRSTCSYTFLIRCSALRAYEYYSVVSITIVPSSFLVNSEILLLILEFDSIV